MQSFATEIIEILQEAAETCIRPRFRLLQSTDIEEKSPGELVTIADREAETFITAKLQQLKPGVPVIGEEATAANPALLAILQTDASCWLLDPLDGTSNFIAGDPHYGVAVAWVEHGEAVASWIWQPELGDAWEAARGAGTRCNGDMITIDASEDAPLETLRGTLHSGYLPPPFREEVQAIPTPHTSAMGSKASAIDYPALIRGELDFIGWSRLLPWDHAPGALLISEAGGVAQRMDGRPYRAADIGWGLMAARSPTIWTTARSTWASITWPR